MFNVSFLSYNEKGVEIRLFLWIIKFYEERQNKYLCSSTNIAKCFTSFDAKSLLSGCGFRFLIYRLGLLFDNVANYSHLKRGGIL